MMPRHLLVANPTAQSGKNAERIERARSFLLSAGLEHDFQATLPDGATVGLLSGLLAGGQYGTVVMMGGDGTFAEVAKGILGSGRAADIRMAMLPTGTGNDQGKSFGLDAADSSLARNVSVVAEGHECRLDAGRLVALDDRGRVIREDLFFDSAGWGISPRVLRLRNEDRKAIEEIPFLRDLWKGRVVYAGALLRTFIGTYIDDATFSAEIVADGVRHSCSSLTDLIVKATLVYGGGWIFDRSARPDDGKFEVVPFTGRRDWVSKAILHLDGSPLNPEALAKVGVTHSPNFSAASIDISFDSKEDSLPLVAQIDGEEFPASARVKIEVLPGALRLVVPAEFASPPQA